MTPGGSRRAPTALIAEDETHLRDELRVVLARLWPLLRIAGEAGNGIEALRLIDEVAPDIAFLDIEMPVLTGLDVAREVQGRCHIVFVTAYDEHAIAAFEHGAVDYVLKPFDVARLAVTVRRLERRVLETPASLEGTLRDLAGRAGRRTLLRWINVSQGNTVRLVDVDEVCYFQSDAGYTRLVTADGEWLIRRSLTDLQDELDPVSFWLIHRGTLVNAAAIDSVTRDFRGRVSVTLKARREKLAVSEAHAHLFRQM